ncbi:hypothetical protein SUGI_0376240 [Cryptomeria japonica]|nr:hypothetical protein SUGI_0376240 [Cryptomeria japonica]
MALSSITLPNHDREDEDERIHSTFASRYVQSTPPRYKMPEKSMPKDAAYQLISDELMLDKNPRLNLASFVTTWMEPECDKLILESLNKNYIDIDEYPVTSELQDRCINMIARLFNSPQKDGENAVGVGTIGSSEAIMLAGLAFKKKWQNKRKAEGKPFDKPNMVTGANVQVCWEKFGKYFEVDIKVVKLRENFYVMDPYMAVDLVDENTICVCAILGSTYNGEFEDVKLLNDLLLDRNKETGWDTAIHVDAASGGFVAPFIYPDLIWDFRLPLVRSINVSGHKYGLVYPGIGWQIWRSSRDLPDELVFHINYLGADQPTFTLNFSKGASHIIAQYYQLIRLGFEGYKQIVDNCRTNADFLVSKLNETEELQKHGWILPAYTMAPDAQNVSLLRAVIREDFTRTLAERLVYNIKQVLEHLDSYAHKKENQQDKTEGSYKVPKEDLKNVSVFDNFLNASKIFSVWKKNTVDKTNGVC